MTEPNVSVEAAEFRRMLRASLIAAAGPGDAPGIVGVLLHTAATDTGQSVLVATATDRFLLSHIHMPCEGSLDEPVFVASGNVRLMAAAARKIAGSVAFTIGDGRIAVSFGADTRDLTFALSGAEFPRKIGQLMSPPEPSADGSAFSPWMFGRVAKIARRLDADYVKVTLAGERKPAVAFVGERCRLLVMPAVRSYMPVPPAFDPFSTAESVGVGGPDAA